MKKFQCLFFMVFMFFTLNTIAIDAQIVTTDLVTGKYSGIPWDSTVFIIQNGTKICWQFDYVDGTISNDSGIVAGAYWPNDPENWPITNGQELRNHELDEQYAAFRYNGGAHVFRSHGQWVRYTVQNDYEGYFHFKFRTRSAIDEISYPMAVTIETADSVHYIDSINIHNFHEQSQEVENVGLTSWFASNDSIFIPEGNSVVRIDMPFVNEGFNVQGKFGEFGFISTDSVIEVIEDTIQRNIYTHFYHTTTNPDVPLEFQMYIPESVDTVKAVCFYVDGGLMNGLWWMFQPGLVLHRNYYAQQGYAFMVANLELHTYWSYNYETLTDWLSDAIFGSMAALGDSTGHPELAYSPLFMFGHSNGSVFSYNFNLVNADRLLGAFLSKGTAQTTIDTETKRKGLKVPLMFVPGENDNTFPTDYVHQGFMRGRNQNAIWSYAVEPERGHNLVTDTSLVLPFFRDVIDIRLPDSVHFTSLPVLNTKEKTTYFANNDNYAIAKKKCYPYDTTLASWLPGESSALAWQQFVSSGTITDTISCNSHIEPTVNKELWLYPNPASNYVIVAGIPDETIEMYNVQGKLVLKASSNFKEQKIAVGHLPQGIYFVKCRNSIQKFSIIP